MHETNDSQIMTIPRLSERLECMLYRRKLELEIEEIRPELDILRNASQELHSSFKFKQILQVCRIFTQKFFHSNCYVKVILVVGNALNGSSFRGSARGFQLEALLKVKNISYT